MPELPEVETTRRGLLPHLKNKEIKKIEIRQNRLRWPITSNLADLCTGHRIIDIKRRGKYLLFSMEQGTIIMHLGMSGCLRLVTSDLKPQKHDHVDYHFDKKKVLRYTDPRRFGAILWTDQNPYEHKLLKHLGPEPLSKEFNGEFLVNKSKNRKLPIKNFIMDSRIVVGVGNIYACESLFKAGIHPASQTSLLSTGDCNRLTVEIKKVLERAIECGGTTLKDFKKADGKPGYFSIELTTYGRAGKPCIKCGHLIEKYKISNRTSYFCQHCQPINKQTKKLKSIKK